MNKYLFQRALNESYKIITNVSTNFSRRDWRRAVLYLMKTNIQMAPFWLRWIKTIMKQDVNATTVSPNKIFLYPNWFAHDDESRAAILLHEYYHTQGDDEETAEAKEQEFRAHYRMYNA